MRSGQQDMQIVGEDLGGEIRLDVYNCLNLLSKKWGDVRNTGIYPTRTLASYGGVNAQGQYVYSLPTDKFGNYQPQQLQVYDQYCSDKIFSCTIVLHRGFDGQKRWRELARHWRRKLTLPI